MSYYSWEATDGICVVCDTPLTGRQEILCSAACRQAHKRAKKLTAEEARERAHGKDCERCGEAFDPTRGRQKYCSPNCASRAKDAGFQEREDAMCELDGCGNSAGWFGEGRARRYCSNAHRQKAYRERRRTAA